MQNNKKAATQRGAAQISERNESTGNSAAAQRNRILAALRTHGSLTTLEAQRRLDCLRPAARVCELRNLGFLISTVWQWDHTPEGMPHRVARYCLLSEPMQEAV
ncbi:helix-turn-helix domain-containing protein [Cupriavidus metallidurans]|uniref:helix-turn-helix domain-containing protein n=1 Tax=Cupriavidus metallidurans TaxID=119219 RepID=UPI0009B8BFCA|nr:helix-turn-helix domain-containing protein [Cupriavidus metallidurans]